MNDDNVSVFCELDVKLNEISVQFGRDIKCRKCIFGRITGCAAMGDGIQACQLPSRAFLLLYQIHICTAIQTGECAKEDFFGMKIVLFSVYNPQW
jgi:hypothetical protein